MKTEASSHNRNAVFFFSLNSSYPAESFRYLRFHIHVNQTPCGRPWCFLDILFAFWLCKLTLTDLWLLHSTHTDMDHSIKYLTIQPSLHSLCEIEGGCIVTHQERGEGKQVTSSSLGLIPDRLTVRPIAYRGRTHAQLWKNMQIWHGEAPDWGDKTAPPCHLLSKAKITTSTWIRQSNTLVGGYLEECIVTTEG